MSSPQFDKAAHKIDRQVVHRVKAHLDEVYDPDDPRSRGKGPTAGRRQPLAVPYR